SSSFPSNLPESPSSLRLRAYLPVCLHVRPFTDWFYILQPSSSTSRTLACSLGPVPIRSEWKTSVRRKTFQGGEAMEKNKSVFGMYVARREAESAVSAFKDAGFSTSDISVLLPKKIESEEEELVTDNRTKAPEGAAVGAGSGAAVGGALGWLLGMGALVIPGIGPVIAAGPILAVLAGV